MNKFDVIWPMLSYYIYVPLINKKCQFQEEQHKQWNMIAASHIPDAFAFTMTDGKCLWQLGTYPQHLHAQKSRRYNIQKCIVSSSLFQTHEIILLSCWLCSFSFSTLLSVYRPEKWLWIQF